MTSPRLSAIEGACFDVLVIGAGANGASAAQHLAASGYSVLLVDKGDFASGSSSRSSRMLGNGMHYLAGGHSPWDFALRPHRFLAGCRMARLALSDRAQMVRTMPERLRRVQYHLPLYRDGLYAPWQFDAGMMVLRMMGTGGVGLGYHRIAPAEAMKRPLLKWLRDPGKISSVAVFDQYQFDWPERVVLDTVLDAEDMGATVLNHTAVTQLSRRRDGIWQGDLSDSQDSGAQARVAARLVLNMAGIWIDRVNDTATGNRSSRKIMGTKGVHIAVRLPPECREASVTWQNRQNEHMYVLPWDGMHYIGPTETVYEGSLDDIHPTEEEIAWIIEETNHMLPGMGITRADVLYSWAGVRPWTHHEDAPKGLRKRVIHDLADEGLPGVLAVTGGPLMSHRSVGKDICRLVSKRLPPSGTPRPISYGARPGAAADGSPAVSNDLPNVTIADLRHAAMHEHPGTLSDLLFRRVKVGWTATMGHEAALPAARAVAKILDWDEARISREVSEYRDRLRHLHLLDTHPASGDIPR